MARVILVVSRSEPTRYAYVRHVFASDTLDVILDRRLGERRSDRRPVTVERRRGDRRGPTPTTDLEKFGWAIVRR